MQTLLVFQSCRERERETVCQIRRLPLAFDCSRAVCTTLASVKVSGQIVVPIEKGQAVGSIILERLEGRSYLTQAERHVEWSRLYQETHQARRVDGKIR
jgi:hypothetical protein